MKWWLLFSCTIIFAAWGCSEDENPAPERVFAPGEGVFILNQGLFMAGNASVSFYDTEDQEVTNELFQSQNDRPLGDVLESATLIDDQLYLVVNNSGAVEIVDPADFSSIGVISGLGSPRYLLLLGDERAYVSELYDDQVYVVDLNSRTVSQTIPFPGWSDEMVKIEDEVFVSQAWLFSEPPTDKVFVIDPAQNAIVDSIAVGIDPGPLVVDRNGQLWVYCNGNPGASIAGGLFRIDPVTRTINRSLLFPTPETSLAPRMALNPAGDTLYYLQADLFALPIEDNELPNTALVRADDRNFYALGVHPETGEVYLGDAIDFQQRGTILRLRSDGEWLDEFQVGVIPTGFVFW